MYYVYVLQNKARTNDLYIGFSANPKRRLAEHNGGQNRATRGKTWRIVYVEGYVDESAARRREQALKRNRRVWRFVRERILAQFTTE